MSRDAEFDDIDWMFPAAAGPTAVERAEALLKRKPVGFIAERDGNQYCVVTKAPLPTSTTKEDSVRRDLIRSLTRVMRLVGPWDEHQVHEWAGDIHRKAPWMSPVSVYLMSEMEKRVRQRLRFTGFDPVLVHGEPGVGKTHYAMMAAEGTGVPVLKLDGSSMSSVFQIAGIERGWASATASPVVKLIADTGIANPVVIIDEVDKVGSGAERAGNPHSALLGMLERLTARAWRCPYTEIEVDLSRVSWFLTANDVSLVPQLLKDRCRVIRANAPTEWDVREFLKNRLEGEDPEIIAQTAKAAQGTSLRRASRMADAVIAAGKKRMLN